MDQSRARKKPTSSRKAPSKYVEIESALRAEIEGGVYPVGSLLPTEHVLCERLSASRFTVRQALAGLKASGHIEPRAGLGTIVLRDKPREAITHTMSSFEDLLIYPGETYRKQLAIAEEQLAPTLAHFLGVASGQKWSCLKAMRLARGTDAPISWLDAYVKPAFADVLDQPNPNGVSILKQIEERHGHFAANAQVEVFVGRIEEDLSEPLQCDTGAPALIILRRYRNSDGEIYLVTYSVHPESRFSLNFEFEKQINPAIA
ncbi:GntR family transcriptional regulator [Labrenzia sp. CE80]|uniref:GntR family transcriptional regulator n=1 Tax=Labrenzia sp. CE80 TaxID=1788986 RepID=UPI00129AFCAD|nr:GntR family transcriptional regulator [Labrenzia sp. CE80]